MNLNKDDELAKLNNLIEASERFSDVYPVIIGYQSLTKQEIENLINEIGQIHDLIIAVESLLMPQEVLMNTLYF